MIGIILKDDPLSKESSPHSDPSHLKPFCQRKPLPILIPPTYNHSHHPTGDHSSQGNRDQTRPMFTCTRTDPLEF